MPQPFYSHAGHASVKAVPSGVDRSRLESGNAAFGISGHGDRSRSSRFAGPGHGGPADHPPESVCCVHLNGRTYRPRWDPGLLPTPPAVSGWGACLISLCSFLVSLCSAPRLPLRTLSANRAAQPGSRGSRHHTVRRHPRYAWRPSTVGNRPRRDRLTHQPSMRPSCSSS